MWLFFFLSLAAIFLGMAGCQIIKGARLINRNEEVYKFQRTLTTIVFREDGDWQARLKVFDRVSYKDMMESKKPLRLDSFFTPEEIEILTKQ